MAYAARSFPAGGPAQDADAWFAAALACLDELRGLPLAAIGVGGHGPALVLADARLRPVAPALTWMDARATDQAERLSRAVGRPVRPTSLAANAMWLREESPDVLARGRWIFSSWDYLASRLVGRPVAFFATPSDLVAATGVPPAMFPAYTAPPAVAGERDGVPVVGCYVDSFNGIVGSGVRALGQGCLNAGSLGSVTVMCRPEQATLEVAGRPAASRLLSATGMSLEWLRSRLLADVTLEGLVEEAAASPAGARGVLWSPSLAGGRGPLLRDDASAALAGLRLHHSRADISRAVLEGAAFSFRLAVDDLRSAGIEIGELRICGGQARSRLWNEIKASALGMELVVPRAVDAAVLGCALLAGTACGIFRDVDEGISRMTAVGERVGPRWDYADAYRRWQALHRYAG